MTQTGMSMGPAVGLGLLTGVLLDKIAIGMVIGAIGEGYNRKKSGT